MKPILAKKVNIRQPSHTTPIDYPLNKPKEHYFMSVSNSDNNNFKCQQDDNERANLWKIIRNMNEGQALEDEALILNKRTDIRRTPLDEIKP